MPTVDWTPALALDGKRFDNFSFHNGGRDVKLQADGKIVVSGATMHRPVPHVRGTLQHRRQP
jgi:hypothetical protein